MKKIPIFFTFDDNYVEPAAVAFYSLLNKAKEDIFYEMYVLSSHISPPKKHILNSVVERFNNATLTFVDTGFFLDEYWNNNTFSSKQGGTVFTSDAIVRCFAARFFPQYDKIIYSDVDVIFVDDISELYEIDLGNKYIAAVKNAFLKHSKSELAHLKQEHYTMLKDTYFAGGIWVLNLDNIRNDELESNMISIIEDKTIIKKWNDQDIMNIACKNKVAYIPLNYISYPSLYDYLIKDSFVSPYTREELYDSIINPKIIHFAAKKPWNSNPQYSNLWWTIFEYLNLKQTPIMKSRRVLENKAKKYRNLMNISIAINIILVIGMTIIFVE